VGSSAVFRMLFFCPILFLLGCSWGQKTVNTGAWQPTPPPLPVASDSLGVLNWTAGISIVAGILSLVITAGRMGLRAIVCGVAMIILSYVIAVYSKLIFLPILIIITIISGCIGYVTIVKAFKQRRS